MGKVRERFTMVANKQHTAVASGQEIKGCGSAAKTYGEAWGCQGLSLFLGQE